MAKGSRILRLSLEISDLDRHVYETLNLTLDLHPSESLQRLTSRLLAMALNYQPGLAFGRGISTAEDATLWLRDEQERVLQWIEVGQVDPQRMQKICRRAELAKLYTFSTQAPRWWQQHGQEFLGLSNLEVYYLDADLIEAVSQHLDGRPKLQLITQEGESQLFIDEQCWQFSPRLWFLAGEFAETLAAS